MLEIGILAGCKYNDAGALTSQVVLHGAGSSCTPGLAYSPFGFKGRPRSGVADADGNYTDGALALYYYEGSTLHTIPIDDGRRSTKLPPLDEGGSCWYADVDDAICIYDGEGNLLLQVPASQKLTIQAKNGPAIVIDGQASTVNVGADPVPLALGSALTSLLEAINVAASALSSATTIANVAAAGLALQTAVQLITDIETNTLNGT